MAKEIIIDSVDVSKCEYFSPIQVTGSACVERLMCCGQTNEFSDDAFTQNAPNLLCERNNNCYFKQFVRAKVKTLVYKTALDEIEKIAFKHSISEDDYNKIRNNKWVYAFSKGYATARWEIINPILDIINNTKEQ